MKKELLFIVLAICCFNLIAQERQTGWKHSLFVELTSNNNNTYSYYDSEGKAIESSIREGGAVNIVYNIDYSISIKFKIGIIGEYSYFGEPGFSSFKPGTGFKFYYVDTKSHYLNLQYGYHIPFDRDKFKEGHQLKLSQYFDVANIFNSNLLIGVYYSYDYFYLEGSKPIFQFSSNDSTLKMYSFGVSLGVEF